MITIYLIVINIITFIIYGLDKLFAIKKKRRVSEKNLFTLTLLGGSLGALLSMNLFRHKTQKSNFKYGVPIVLIIHLIFLINLM